MKRTALLLASIALAVLLASEFVLAQQATPPASERSPAADVIPGRYIVVLEEEVRDPTAVALEHASRHGVEVFHTYQHAVRGYAARIPDRRLEEVRADGSVAYVEPDRVAYAEAQRLPWGINRVDADASSTKAGNGSGAVSNVRAYVIDSGIDRATRISGWSTTSTSRGTAGTATATATARTCPAPSRPRTTPGTWWGSPPARR
jgi:hypothetical protein